MKTQVHTAAPYSKPLDQSRNVGAVSNPEDRQGFDDLFEDPDQGLHDAAPADASSSFSAHPPADATPAEPVWHESVADSQPVWDQAAPVEMRNVNVLGPTRTGSAPAEPAARVEPAASAGPEFVAPMEEFNSGFMAPVAGAVDSAVDWPLDSGSASPESPAMTPAMSPAQGRLYRSTGAEGPAAASAILAMDTSVVRISTDPTVAPPTTYRPAGVLGSDEQSPPPSASTYLPPDDQPTPAPRETDGPGASARHALRAAAQPAGLTYSGAAVVILAATVIVGFIDAFINHRLGWLTGIALVASAVYAAVNVRLADAWAPAILAPLGFMAATLTAGQLTRGSSGSWIVREGYMIFRSLAVNAPWIIGATLICAGIAFWRRRSA